MRRIPRQPILPRGRERSEAQPLRRLIRLAGHGLMMAGVATGLMGLPQRDTLAQEGREGQESVEALASKVPGKVFGAYDLDELRRLLEIARESGFSDEEVKKITVEDESGNVINAWEYLQALERKRREEEARLAEIRSRVYLTPKDVHKELDSSQPEDLTDLRGKLFFR